MEFDCKLQNSMIPQSTLAQDFIVHSSEIEDAKDQRISSLASLAKAVLTLFYLLKSVMPKTVIPHANVSFAEACHKARFWPTVAPYQNILYDF
jgi:Na+/pantothenate symporter